MALRSPYLNWVGAGRMRQMKFYLTYTLINYAYMTRSTAPGSRRRNASHAVNTTAQQECCLLRQINDHCVLLTIPDNLSLGAPRQQLARQREGDKTDHQNITCWEYNESRVRTSLEGDAHTNSRSKLQLDTSKI